jgi:signal peptidase I
MKTRPKIIESNDPGRRETPLEFLASNCILVIIALFAFGFVFENFVIPSSSMASTLLVGDHVLVDRSTLAPPASWARWIPYRGVKRGDIVVFYKPTEEPNGEHLILVKRVIGVPGDRLHLRDGVVFVNGAVTWEPYAEKPLYHNPYRDDFPSAAPSDAMGVTAQWSVELPNVVQSGDLVVPPDSYFVMGDNRAKSLDSRYWGFVPRQNVLGRPLFVYWSFPTPDGELVDASRAELARFTLHEVFRFFDQTRWGRTLHQVE